MNTADFIENFQSFENTTNRLIQLVNREISRLPTKISSMDNMDPNQFDEIYHNLQNYSLELETKMETIKKFLRNRRKRPRYMIDTLNNLYEVENLLDTTFTRMESIIRKRRGPIHNGDEYGNENFGKSRTKIKKIKYYSGRKSPRLTAAIYSIGFRQKGLDGNYWIIVENSNGLKRWKKMRNRNTMFGQKTRMDSFVYQQTTATINNIKKLMEDLDYKSQTYDVFIRDYQTNPDLKPEPVIVITDCKLIYNG
jgi:hypothetical protein